MKKSKRSDSASQVYASPPMSSKTTGSSPPIDGEENDMLNDPDFMERFEQAMDDIANGRTRKWKGVKRNV